MKELGATFSCGMRVLVSSAVPQGSGVSSSAAVEVATMQAVVAAVQLQVQPDKIAILCQMVENLVVGAPCGVMDQFASCCGNAGQLMALLCQPAELLEPVGIPRELALWGIDSGIRHAVSGADYGSVRVGAFMGYRAIAAAAGFRESRTEGQRVQIEDPVWQGYLANIAPSVCFIFSFCYDSYLAVA